ncbi:hypothetical protein CWE08_04445 [Aliidiomarina iranensis]|uniref:CBS domain-containing protein n=1 Tax=Aliidiomarina iranensis TaxID=1434071 RepID=A0A432W0B7_9GAMM|nr:hypothetical protein [Aliidiomarina iranensis]RUO22433.1 hypothetical protein CWE08_04445 [Aliidiomarina iranensis]
MSTYTALNFSALPMLTNKPRQVVKSRNLQDKLSWNENALEVLIEFSGFQPLQVNQALELEKAEALLSATRARYACVVNDAQEFVGILPKQELYGRAAINLARDLNLPHKKISIDYLMIPLARLPIVSKQQLAASRIGDVVATLHRSGHDYLLVQDNGDIVGLIPALHIVEKTGESVQIPHHANSFVEIMQAVRHRETIE